MRYTFRQVRKLWIVYLFLLFFSFFMFAISINVYLQSIQDFSEHHRDATDEKFRKKAENVVVAHYIGTGNIFGNMTEDDYNSNNFNPIEGEGAYGRPVMIPARENFKMQRMFKINSFNIMASDRIPLNRSLRDYRMKQCREKDYGENLEGTSVIIVFHNEAWSVLLRTLWSIINRSPKHLIEEIILVDDASDRKYLKSKLESYISTLPVRTTIHRLAKREGLVPARLLGAQFATGKILTFLDAHIECSEGWLEPLLARIKDNPKSVICPVIDIISDDNFSYTKTFEQHWGAFNWQLSFRWFVLGRSALENKQNMTTPIPTPGMAGGLFSIRRDYFYEIGSYDKEMKIWGGENVEISFRVWQCGGVVEIHPCSHVGHIFRKSSPYTFPGGIGDVLGSNLARAAMVWMDEWTNFFFHYSSVKHEVMGKLDVTDRIKLRKDLKCKSFSWYLKNVWPENFFPADDRFFGKIVWLNGHTDIYNVYKKLSQRLSTAKEWPDIISSIQDHGETLLKILHLEKDSCLRSDSPSNPFAISSALKPVTVGDCSPDDKLQDMFVITAKGQVMTNENICLDYFPSSTNKYLNNTGTNVQLFQCYDESRQHWNYDVQTQRIIHKQTHLCLTVTSEKKGRSKLIEAAECQNNEISQKWGLVPLPWKR